MINILIAVNFKEEIVKKVYDSRDEATYVLGLSGTYPATLVKEELISKNNAYIKAIADINEWVEQTRPKFSNFIGTKKEFEDALVAHGKEEDNKYFALERPEYLGFEFFIF